MKRFAVIGLGQWGSRLASNLAAAGCEVVAIDRNKNLVDAVRDQVTLSVALDSTDETAMKEQGIDQVDVAVVSIGNNFEGQVLTTTLLKSLGVKYVLSRADTPTARRVLEQVGADGVVSPEEESADRWSHRLLNPHFVNQFDLDDKHSIVELPVPEQWVGKTLKELDIRKTMGVHIVAVKDTTSPDVKADRGKKNKRDTMHIPDPDKPLTETDILVIMGPDASLVKLPRDKTSSE